MQPVDKTNSKFDRRVAIAGVKAAVVTINYLLHHENHYAQRTCSTLQDTRDTALRLLDSMMADEEGRPTVDVPATARTADDEGIPF